MLRNLKKLIFENLIHLALLFFRIHCEFQLNEPPLFPFWFTPAAMFGEIIMKKDASEITYFHMYVPTRKQLNVGK